METYAIRQGKVVNKYAEKTKIKAVSILMKLKKINEVVSFSNFIFLAHLFRATSPDHKSTFFDVHIFET